MKTRIITAVIAIVLFIPICLFSDYIVFPIAISLLSIIGVYEMAKCLGHHKRFVLCIPMFIIAATLPILRYVLRNKKDADYKFFFIAFVIIFFMLIYSLTYVMLRKNRDNIFEILTFYSMFFYIVGCFSAISVIRYMPNGQYFYLIIFISSWTCDTFAYFAGRLLGRHKLIPQISPKKTVEGAIGGVVFSVVGLTIYYFILFYAFGIEITYWKILIIAIILSIVSQIGDLIASCVKRQYNVKDYGNIFKGHGGVLDRFDSVMLVAPTLYILIRLFLIW